MLPEATTSLRNDVCEALWSTAPSSATTNTSANGHKPAVLIENQSTKLPCKKKKKKKKKKGESQTNALSLSPTGLPPQHRALAVQDPSQIPVHPLSHGLNANRHEIRSKSPQWWNGFRKRPPTYSHPRVVGAGKKKRLLCVNEEWKRKKTHDALYKTTATNAVNKPQT